MVKYKKYPNHKSPRKMMSRSEQRQLEAAMKLSMGTIAGTGKASPAVEKAKPVCLCKFSIDIARWLGLYQST